MSAIFIDCSTVFADLFALIPVEHEINFLSESCNTWLLLLLSFYFNFKKNKRAKRLSTHLQSILN